MKVFKEFGGILVPLTIRIGKEVVIRADMEKGQTGEREACHTLKLLHNALEREGFRHEVNLRITDSPGDDLIDSVRIPIAR